MKTYWCRNVAYYIFNWNKRSHWNVVETKVKCNLVIYRHSLFDLTWPGFNSLQIRAEAPGRDLVPLVGGAYLAGEQLLLHAVLHGLWTGSSGSYQAPLGFLQPQLQLADSLQAHMEDTFTGPGPSWARLLRGLGHKHNTPGWTSVLQGHRYRAWRAGGGSWAVTVAVTLPEPVVALIFKQILLLTLPASSPAWLSLFLFSLRSHTLSSFFSLSAPPTCGRKPLPGAVAGLQWQRLFITGRARESDREKEKKEKRPRAAAGVEPSEQ